MATSINNFYRGDTKNWKFEFGDGVDIAGWKIYFTMKEDKDDADADAMMQVIATAGGNVLDDVYNGLMYVTVTSSDYTKIEPDTKYFYGFQRVVPGSPVDVKTLLTGTVKVLQDITITTA